MAIAPRPDDLDRLTSAVRTGAGAGNEGFGYDAVGNRQSSSGNGVTTGASYNARNELTARDSGGPTRFLGALNEPGTVTVNGQPAAMLANNVFEAEVPLSDGSNTVHVQARDASGNVATQDYQVNVTPQHEGYTYDLNGNLETKTEGSDTWHYYWSAENQLVRVEKNSVELARFSYDPLRRRVRKIAGGVTVSYVYDGQDIIRETRSDGPTYTYVHGPGIDEPLARIEGSNPPTYYHADGLGSIVKMTDQSGATLSNRLYDTWGNLQLGADEPGYAFAGYQWDPEIGLYYVRARYLDSKVGRFISEDPIRFQGGNNFYAYVAGRPTTAIDPFGLVDVNLFDDIEIDVHKQAKNYNLPDIFTVAGHGWPQAGVQDFRDGQDVPVSVAWLARVIRNGEAGEPSRWHEGMTVRLMVCYAGGVNPSTGKIFAQELANALQTNVQATPQTVEWARKRKTRLALTGKVVETTLPPAATYQTFCPGGTCPEGTPTEIVEN